MHQFEGNYEIYKIYIPFDFAYRFDGLPAGFDAECQFKQFRQSKHERGKRQFITADCNTDFIGNRAPAENPGRNENARRAGQRRADYRGRRTEKRLDRQQLDRQSQTFIIGRFERI